MEAVVEENNMNVDNLIGNIVLSLKVLIGLVSFSIFPSILVWLLLSTSVGNVHFFLVIAGFISVGFVGVLFRGSSITM